jgi:hypothetical protein
MAMDKHAQGPRWTFRLWIAAGILLLLPLLAMQVTDEVAWDAFDFVVAAALFGIVCGGIDLASRSGHGAAFAAAAASALLGGLLIVWANLAVGIVGNEEDTLNLLFFGVVVLGLALAALSRFRQPGLSRAMTATAAAQVGGRGARLHPQRRIRCDLRRNHGRAVPAFGLVLPTKRMTVSRWALAAAPRSGTRWRPPTPRPAAS